MLIAESKLRSVIRSIIKESSQVTVNPKNKIKEIIRNWVINEVDGEINISEHAETHLIYKIIGLYSELGSDGKPKNDNEYGYDFDYWCDDILEIIDEYARYVADNITQKGYYVRNNVSESDIEVITDKIFEALKDSDYVEKALVKVGKESLMLSDENVSIEEKILNALKNDITEEEYKKIKPNIRGLINYVKEDFEDNIKRGASFEEAYKEAKDYLETFYKFD